MSKLTFNNFRITDMNKPQQQENNDRPLSFGELVKSVLMAFLGVQSNSNRMRDFSKGKLSHFIIIGVIFGLLFILTIVGVVNLVIGLSAN
jgi:hypothetical protein